MAVDSSSNSSDGWPNSGRLLPVAVLMLCGLVFAASWFGQFEVEGHALAFVALMTGAGGCFLLAVRHFKAVSPRRMAGVFWSTAILARLFMLPCAPGDDFWRYVWEGRVQNAGGNPYITAPAAPELVELRGNEWAFINHPETPAVYPPAAQLIFRAVTAVTHEPIAFKLLFAAADLLTALLLVKLIEGRRRYVVAAWYAWNPAVIYAFAGGAHYDSLMLLAMTAALLALHRAARDLDAPPVWSWSIGSAAALGVAIALKLVPIFLLPVLALALGRRSAVLLISCAIPLALSSCFGGPAVVLGPVQRFADVTRFNDLFWWLPELAFGANPWQRNWPFTVVLVLAVAAAAILLRREWPRAALWALGLALVLSPVLHPWYATWILPLACWRRTFPWVVLSLSAMAAFLLWETTQFWTEWQPNLLTRSLVILPPLAAWLWQLRTRAQTETP